MLFFFFKPKGRTVSLSSVPLTCFIKEHVVSTSYGVDETQKIVFQGKTGALQSSENSIKDLITSVYQQWPHCDLSKRRITKKLKIYFLSCFIT